MGVLVSTIRDGMVIEDRMAIVRLDGTGIRSNGYQVTAMAGDKCDVHGDSWGWVRLLARVKATRLGIILHQFVPASRWWHIRLDCTSDPF